MSQVILPHHQATISTWVFQSYNPWNSCIPWYSSTGFPEQRTLHRITRCSGSLLLICILSLLLSLAPPSFNNPYCNGGKPVPDWKQYRHLQSRQSPNSWQYCPGTDSSREAYFKDLCDLLCRLLRWKKAHQGPRGACGQTEGICQTSYFLLEEQESGMDNYYHNASGLNITYPCICQKEEKY